MADQAEGIIRAIPEPPSTRDVVLRSHRPKDAPVGHDAVCGWLGGAGDKLYQQANYQDGQAHGYALNIPTLGGIAAGVYPTPGNPNTAGGIDARYLSLNISGSDAGNFMTGQFVTPQFVADQA
jgi:hypothetical protein